MPETSNVNTAPVERSAGKKRTGLGTKARGAAEAIHGGTESILCNTLGTSNTLVGRTAAATQNDELANKGRLEMERGLAKLKGNVERQAEQSGPNANTGYPPGLPLGRGAHERPAVQGHNEGHNDFPHGPQNTGQFAGQIPPASHQPAVQQPGIAPAQGLSAKPDQQAAKQISPDEPVHPHQSAHPPADLSSGTEHGHTSSGGTTYHHRDDGISGIPRHQLDDIQVHANHPNDQATHDETLDQNVQPPTGKAAQPYVSSGGPEPDSRHRRDEGFSRIPQLEDQSNNMQAKSRDGQGQPKVVLPRQDVSGGPDLTSHGAPAIN